MRARTILRIAVRNTAYRGISIRSAIKRADRAVIPKIEREDRGGELRYIYRRRYFL